MTLVVTDPVVPQVPALLPAVTETDAVFGVVVLVIATLVAGASAAVVRFYAKALRVAPRKHGLLLWHIVSIATAVTGMWMFQALGQLQLLGWLDTPRWVRQGGTGVCGVLTLVALAIIATETRRRVRATSSTTTVITTTQGVAVETDRDSRPGGDAA